MSKHLVFYDGECGLCDQVVQYLLQKDRQKIFLFAPLKGETASRKLKNIPSKLKTVDSLILIENYGSDQERLHVLAKGAFRIAYLLGGWWQVPGLLYFLPGVFTNWGYRLIARHRHRFFPKTECVVMRQEMKERFLP